MTRIAPGVRRVSWIGEGSVAIGHHDCAWCKAETPLPPDSVVIDFVRDYPSTSTLWPTRDATIGWQPPGWTWGDDGLLCPSCSVVRVSAVQGAKDSRKVASR